MTKMNFVPQAIEELNSEVTEGWVDSHPTSVRDRQVARAQVLATLEMAVALHRIADVLEAHP